MYRNLLAGFCCCAAIAASAQASAVRIEFTETTLENGLRVMVPPFVATGEKIVVDTNEMTYVRRAD